MRALTLHQPWASLIAVGAKSIETRSWRTNYRGPLAIHAGKRVPSSSLRVGEYGVRGFGRTGLALVGPGLPEFRSTPRLEGYLLPLGKVVASATLIDVQPCGHLVEVPWTSVARRPAYGYPWYEVTVSGEVFTSVAHPRGAGKLMSASRDSEGYMSVPLRNPTSDGTVRRSERLHVLVGRSWLDWSRQDGRLFRHHDGDKDNNAAWNLRWGSHGENLSDAYRMGERPRGEARALAKFTDEQVAAFRARHAEGESQERLAAEAGCALRTMQRLLHGVTYRGEREAPDDTVAQSAFAWLLGDVKPTTERCPWCMGEGWAWQDEEANRRFDADEGNLQCPVCEGRGSCDPIPATGRQGLWEWDPATNPGTLALTD